MEERDRLVNFIVHLSEKGVIKNGTALVDEVKYYTNGLNIKPNGLAKKSF